MDLQDIFAFAALALAVAFLARKFLLKRRRKAGACGDDCGCH
jgi:hypothetical protein